MQLGKNHQVLAVGYETIGDHIRIHVYDPNYPLDDTITVEYDYQAQDRGQPASPRWLRNLLGDDFFDEVKSDIGQGVVTSASSDEIDAMKTELPANMAKYLGLVKSRSCRKTGRPWT